MNSPWKFALFVRVEVLVDCLLVSCALSAVEPSDDSFEFSVEILRVVFEYYLWVQIAHKSVSVVLALKEIHQILLIERFVFWVLFLYGVKEVAKGLEFLIGNRLEKILIELQMGQVEILLDFLHDEFENEFHVFFVSLYGALALYDSYMVEKEVLVIYAYCVFLLGLFGNPKYNLH